MTDAFNNFAAELDDPIDGSGVFQGEETYEASLSELLLEYGALYAGQRKLVDQIDKLSEQLATLNSKIAEHSERVKLAVLEMGRKSIVRDGFRVTVSPTTRVVVIDDEDLPDRYIRQVPSVDGKLLRQDCLAGVRVPGTEVIKGTSVKITDLSHDTQTQ